MGPDQHVAEAFGLLEEHAARVGLVVRRHKSHLLTNTSAGFVGLGVPVGPRDWVEEELQRLILEKAAALERVVDFDLRHAYPMVKACVNARPMYWARTCAPGLGTEAFEQFDTVIDRALTTLTEGSEDRLPERAQTIRHLPMSLGGLGLRRLSLIRNASWAASFSRSEEHTSELQSLMSITYAVF